ncbi:Mannan polymerase II complex anp1 subunit [Saitoella coloradoensis]
MYKPRKKPSFSLPTNGRPNISSSSRYSISPSRFAPRTSRPPLLQRPYIRILLLLCLPIIFLLGLFRHAIFESSPAFGFEYPDTDSIFHYDLNSVGGTARGWEREERVLFCVPLRDASQHMPMFFSHLNNLTYPHHLIDLAFLVSESKDNTLENLISNLEAVQAGPQPFGRIQVLEKDFGQVVGQSFSDRHGFAAQGPRRKAMARARNWLLSATLRPEHSWVYWRDADVETCPPTILEDLMRHNRDIIVPNVWRPLPDWLGGEQPYDLNSWAESETALQLAATLDEDAVIVEGYAEYATWRPHLAYLRDPYGDPEMEMEMDGVGGVSILARAQVFRSGCHFPAFSFQKHAETEGFGKMAKRMGYDVIGLPHYTIWHLYEPSVEDLQHMAEMEAERLRREKEEAEAVQAAEEEREEWNKDKVAMQGLRTDGEVRFEVEDGGVKMEVGGGEEGPAGKGAGSGTHQEVEHNLVEGLVHVVDEELGDKGIGGVEVEKKKV